MSHIFKLDGKFDSSNAPQLEKMLNDEYEKHGVLSLDADKLLYISSAGLRVLLKLRKKQGRLEVFNVSPENYEIFEVTGFTDLLDVKTKLREVPIEGCELIGKGGNGSVYRISQDEIIKVYTANTSLESIENERRLARCAFVAGVPTAIPYDMVRVGETYGIVFEMIKADVIGKKLMNEPESFDMYAQKYADTFKEIHSVSLAGNGLPLTSQIFLDYLSKLSDWYDDKQLARLEWFIRQIPERDTMVHGDFHTNNIMVQGDELLIIDMAEISCGNPIYDLASSYYAHRLNPRLDPDSVMKYLNVTPEIAVKLWDIIMKTYFETDDPQKLEHYNSVIEGFCMLKAALIPAIWVNMPDAHKKGAVENAKKLFFPQMERLLDELSKIQS